jgi:hypothetical protein
MRMASPWPTSMKWTLSVPSERVVTGTTGTVVATVDDVGGERAAGSVGVVVEAGPDRSGEAEVTREQHEDESEQTFHEHESLLSLGVLDCCMVSGVSHA